MLNEGMDPFQACLDSFTNIVAFATEITRPLGEQMRSQSKRSCKHLQLEQLEDRHLLAADVYISEFAGSQRFDTCR